MLAHVAALGTRCVVELCAPAALGGGVLVRVGACDVSAEVEAMLSLRGAERTLRLCAAPHGCGGAACGLERAACAALDGADGSRAPANADALAVARAQECALRAHSWLRHGGAPGIAAAGVAVARRLPSHGPLWAFWASELRAGRSYEPMLHGCAALERALVLISRRAAAPGEAGAPPPPPLLRDLVASPQAVAALGAGGSEVLRAACSPQLLNVRNLAWHGFLPPARWRPADLAPYAALVLLLVLRLSLALPAGASEESYSGVRPARGLGALGAEALSDSLAQLEGGRATWPWAMGAAELEASALLLAASPCMPAGHAAAVLAAAAALAAPAGAAPCGAVRSAVLLLPALEAALRAAFARANPCEAAGVPACLRSYYATLDGYGQRHVHQLLLLPTLFASGAPNRLTAQLGGPAVRLLADLLLQPHGPLLRARLAHGEVAPGADAADGEPAVGSGGAALAPAVVALWHGAVLCAAALDGALGVGGALPPGSRRGPLGARGAALRSFARRCGGYRTAGSDLALARARAARCGARLGALLRQASAAALLDARGEGGEGEGAARRCRCDEGEAAVLISWPPAEPDPGPQLRASAEPLRVQAAFRAADRALLAALDAAGERAAAALRRAARGGSVDTPRALSDAEALRAALGAALGAPVPADGDDTDGGSGAWALSALEGLRRLLRLEEGRVAGGLVRAAGRAATSAQRRQLVLACSASRPLRRAAALALVAICAELAAPAGLNRGRVLAAVQGLLAALEAGKGLEEQLRAAEALLCALVTPVV